MSRPALIALALATATTPLAPAHGAGQTGKLRVCRYPGVTGAEDRQAIPIPAGSGFVSGDDPKTGDQLKPYFRLATTAAASLPPKPGCVTVDATVVENPNGFAITTRYPTFLPSQLVVPGAEIIGRVAADFK